jgi:hypothetical protein
MQIPLTGFSTIGDAIISLVAWLFIGYRINRSGGAALRPVRLMHKFFLYIAVFFTLMGLPLFVIYSHPEQFPALMAWGYTVGHIFLYIALVYLVLMVMEIIPQLTSKQHWAVWLGTVANVGVTILTAVTMIWGRQPAFDYANNVTHFNAAPAVGISIVVFAMLSFLPPAILFLINTFRGDSGRRLRSLLLGFGFLVVTAAGPLHDNAQTGQVYAIADVFTFLAMCLIGAGVAYRLEQSWAPARAATPVQA